MIQIDEVVKTKGGKEPLPKMIIYFSVEVKARMNKSHCDLEPLLSIQVDPSYGHYLSKQLSAAIKYLDKN